MPQHIPTATRIPVPGGKVIDEYIGRVNSATAAASVARMRSPAGWAEPAQEPEFDEITLVLSGVVRIEHDGGTLDVASAEGEGTTFTLTLPRAAG